MDRTFAVVLVALTLVAVVLVSIHPETGLEPTSACLPRVGQRDPPTVINPVAAVARYNRAHYIEAARAVESLHRAHW